MSEEQEDDLRQGLQSRQKLYGRKKKKPGTYSGNCQHQCYWETYCKAGGGKLGRNPLYNILACVYSFHEYVLSICYKLGPKATRLHKIRLGPGPGNQD